LGMEWLLCRHVKHRILKICYHTFSHTAQHIPKTVSWRIVHPCLSGYMYSQTVFSLVRKWTWTSSRVCIKCYLLTEVGLRFCPWYIKYGLDCSQGHLAWLDSLNCCKHVIFIPKPSVYGLWVWVRVVYIS